MKKISIALSTLCALALCCGFTLKRPHAAQGKELTVEVRTATQVPITILSATQGASGLSVQVRNDADAPVEYFELRMDGARACAGRNTMDTQAINNPRLAKEIPLSLTPGETRIFDFPGVKPKGSTIWVYMALLSNGKGFLKGGWIKKLDKAKADGLLWDVDHEENIKRRLKQTGMREFPRNVGKSAPISQNCLQTRDLVRITCGASSECFLYRYNYDQTSYGVYVFWLTTDCDPVGCGQAIEDYQYGVCG